MQLEILKYPDPILRTRGESVAEITDEIRQLAKDMIETMDKVEGAGLAAPQVGRSLRLFVLRFYISTEDGHWVQGEPRVYINPKLSSPGEQMLTETEGCLSFPNLKLDIDRPDRITIKAMDLEGNIFTEKVEGYNARIIMHENDHINGVLFIDRVDPQTRKNIDPFLKNLSD